MILLPFKKSMVGKNKLTPLGKGMILLGIHTLGGWVGKIKINMNRQQLCDGQYDADRSRYYICCLLTLHSMLYMVKWHLVVHRGFN